MAHGRKLPRALAGCFVLCSLLAGTGLFVGCSLTSLVDVKIAECPSADEEGDAYCRRVLNAEEGNYEECASYECVRVDDYFQCQAIEEEICDGLDNDCDYLIDEPSGDEANLVLESTSLESGIEEASSSSVTDSSEFGEVLYVASQGGTAVAIDLGGDNATSEPVTLWAQNIEPGDSPEDYGVAQLTELEEGCFPAIPPGSASSSCRLNDTQVAAGSRLGFFAYVNGQSCTSGELRVGAIDANAKEEFIDRGLGFRDPTYRGVRTLGSACSSNLTDACEELKLGDVDLDDDDFNRSIRESCGVSHPAIAALDDQALVAYLGTDNRADECPEEEANVLTLLLHERIEDGAGEKFAWADPSLDGEPQVLTTTLSGAAPGILALKETGFLVATGTTNESIRLSFVPKQNKPPATTGTSCPEDCDDRDYHTAKITDIVENWETLSVSSEGSLADGIRLSFLDLEDDEDDDVDEVLVLLTWLEGCALDAEMENAFFRVLRVDLSGDEPELLEASSVGQLGATSRAPLGVPSSEDFVVSGLERSGKEATDSDTGGFYVVTHDRGLRVVRVAGFDGKLVDSRETIEGDEPDEVYLGPAAQDGFFTHLPGDSELRSSRVTCD